jgi:GNAT superfamily N-acetyltransferase
MSGAGFRWEGRIEIVYIANAAEIRRSEAPIPGLSVRRFVGSNGTRFSAMLDSDVIGLIEVELRDHADRLARRAVRANIGNLHVADGYCGRGIDTWLMRQAAEWLQLAQIDRVSTTRGLKSGSVTHSSARSAFSS